MTEETSRARALDGALARFDATEQAAHRRLLAATAAPATAGMTVDAAIRRSAAAWAAYCTTACAAAATWRTETTSILGAAT